VAIGALLNAATPANEHAIDLVKWIPRCLPAAAAPQNDPA
jgi:hypothetical protein